MLLAILMTTPHILLILILKTQFQVLNLLLHDSFIWFQQNVLQENPDNCHFLLSTNQDKLTNVNSNAMYDSSSEN